MVPTDSKNINFKAGGIMGSAAPKPLFIYQKYKGFSTFMKEKYFRIGF